MEISVGTRSKIFFYGFCLFRICGIVFYRFRFCLVSGVDIFEGEAVNLDGVDLHRARKELEKGNVDVGIVECDGVFGRS